MAWAYTMFSKLERGLREKDTNVIVSNEWLGSAEEEVQKFKALVEEKFDAHCETGLYILKFYLLDHVEVLDLFESLDVFTSFAFERFIVHIKWVY